MLIATKTNNLQQQQQQQLIGSNGIKKNNNNKKQQQQHDTTIKLTEFACGRKEDALLPCDSEAKQRHEALAKKWNMKYMHYKNNNNGNNINKEFDKQQHHQQQQQSADTTYLNIRVGSGNVERARRGRRPNGRGVGSRGRGMFKGNMATTGKEMPANSLYAAAMLTVAKMKVKRGGNTRARGGNNNRAKARLYATLIGSTTNSSESCESKIPTTTTTTTEVIINRKN